MVRHDSDAQDVLQSVFAKAFVALDEGRRDAPLRPWLYRIAHNEAISTIRRATARRGPEQGGRPDLRRQGRCGPGSRSDCRSRGRCGRAGHGAAHRRRPRARGCEPTRRAHARRFPRDERDGGGHGRPDLRDALRDGLRAARQARSRARRRAGGAQSRPGTVTGSPDTSRIAGADPSVGGAFTGRVDIASPGMDPPWPARVRMDRTLTPGPPTAKGITARPRPSRRLRSRHSGPRTPGAALVRPGSATRQRRSPAAIARPLATAVCTPEPRPRKTGRDRASTPSVASTSPGAPAARTVEKGQAAPTLRARIAWWEV